MAGPTNPKQRIRVFVSAGEASGDAYAARLIQALRKDWNADVEGAELEFGGLAGSRTEKVGVNLIQNTSFWGAMGITQSLKVYPKVVGSYYRAKRSIAKGPPGLMVAIDFGYANIRLSRHAKNHGWQVLYMVPPGSWRRDRQGKDLPFVTDAIATPFEWSADILRNAGANVFWFGHPIKQLIAEQNEILQRSCQRDRAAIAVLPGSRKHEIDCNLPLIAKVVETLDYPLEMALTPNSDPIEFEARWAKLSSRPATFTVGKTADVLLRANAAIVCSGTATLEAALCDCPMVVIYELPNILKAEMKLRFFKRPKFISLPNIMLDYQAVPEHVEFHGISADLVRAQLSDLMENGPERQKQMKAFAELDQLLGPSDAVNRTADLAVTMLRKLVKP